MNHKTSRPLVSHLLFAAALIIYTGCGDPHGIDPDLDCSEECGEECNLEYQFDFEGYEASCDEAEEGPRFCGISDDEECVEPDFDIEEITVADIHDGLKTEEISCEWLVQQYVHRILWHDFYIGDGIAPLNAILHLNEQALETARTLDGYQRCEGELSGPLHCVPFGIKTNFASKEVPVTNGSLAFGDMQADFDAFSVDRLRQSGAIMIGSTTMDEQAAGAHGLAGRTGRTGNAYDRTLNSGGSSAGSGVGVASNMMVAGLGTDNCSSLTIPASYNGLVTLRSSHQLVSTDGIMPSNRLDAIAGPLTRTVEDQALFLNEMTAFNPHYGPHCTVDEITAEDDYTEFLDEDGLQGKRIGILEAVREDPDDEDADERVSFQGASDEVEEQYEEFFDDLESLGAEVVPDIELDELPMNRRSSGSGWDTDNMLENISGGPSSFVDACDTDLFSRWIYEDRDACYNRADQSKSNLESRLDSGLAQYRDNRSYVEGVMDEYDVDALIYPPDRRGTAYSQYTWSMCILASVTGLPTAVVPIGHANGGRPVGMSFTGRMFDDGLLLQMIYAYEQATAHRQPPQMPELEGTPPIDVDDFHDIGYDAGLTSFDEYLGDSEDKYDLSEQAFYNIVYDILDERGVEELLPE